MATNTTNSSVNVSGSSYSPFDTYSCMLTPIYTVFTVTVVSVVIISTLFGNSLILASILKFPNSFKRGLYVCIGNLALADLMLGVVLLLYPAEYIFTGLQQSYSFCTLRISLAIVSIAVSEGTLVVISIDRTMAVIKPLEHAARTDKTKVFKGILVMVWLVSVFAVFGPAYLQLSSRRQGTRDGSFLCRGSILMPKIFHYITVGVIVMELIVNFILYVVMSRTLKKHMSSFPESKLKQGAKTMMMIVVMVVFAVSWSPFVGTQLVRSISQHTSRNPTYLCWSEYLVLLGFCNSGINWIIYGFMNVKFKSAFMAILRCEGTLITSRSSTTTNKIT